MSKVLDEFMAHSLAEGSITEDTLAHYGVKGMKWGKRGAKVSKPAVPKPPDSADHKKTRKLAAKPISSLSNDQLKIINQRLQLEKSFKELNGNRSVLDRGEKHVKEVLDKFGTVQRVYNLATSPMVQKVAEVVKDFR